MKKRNPYKSILVGVFSGKKIFTKIDKTVLDHLNEREFVFDMDEKYVQVKTKTGAPVGRLQVVTWDLLRGHLAPRRGDDEVHHANEDALDNRIENLVRLSAARHRAHHRSRRRSKRDPKPDVLGYYRPHAPAPVKSVTPIVYLVEQMEKEVPRAVEPSQLPLRILVGLATTGCSIEDLEPGRGLTHGQETYLLGLALADNYDGIRKLAEEKLAFMERQPIPRNVTRASFFDKKSRENGISPIRRGCRKDEAALVCLLAAFDRRAALDYLNQHLPADVQAHLVGSTPATVRVGVPGGYTWVTRDPAFSRGALERMLRRPAVALAMERLRRFGRLPKVCGYWHPAPMKKKTNFVLPTGSRAGAA